MGNTRVVETDGGNLIQECLCVGGRAAEGAVGAGSEDFDATKTDTNALAHVHKRGELKEQTGEWEDRFYIIIMIITSFFMKNKQSIKNK